MYRRHAFAYTYTYHHAAGYINIHNKKVQALKQVFKAIKIMCPYDLIEVVVGNVVLFYY